MRKVKEFLRKYWLGCMCVLTVLIFAVVLSVSSFCGEKKSISASAEEVTASAAPTTQPRASSGIDLSKYPTANLIPYPYIDEDRTSDGVTFAVNEDGSLILNGTSTGYSLFYFYRGIYGPLFEEGKTYSFSCSYGLISYVEKEGSATKYLTSGTFTWGSGWILGTVYIQLTTGQTVDNLTVYPMLNVGETAYPYSPPYDLIYNDGYESGESAGHKTGYDEGYKNATEELSSLLITKGNGAYATPRNNVVGYVGGTDYLQFDTASGSADLTGLPNDPYVALRLEASVDVTSQYTISYKSLQGKCSLCFYLDGVIFNLFTLPETTTPVTINFTLPYGLGKSYVVNELVLVGYKEPLEFDFDENHYTTGGPCVLKGMELYCIFDAKGAYDAGYDVGYSEGSEVSEQEKQEKYEAGKQAGYNQGISEKTNAFSYINAIITAPVDAVLSMFDVDFMGWNLKGLLGLLVCGAIIAIVIKVLL